MTSDRKYVIYLPEDLAESVRARAPAGGFSAYAAAAVEHSIAMARLREIVADFENDNGPLTRAEVDEARALLRHDRRRTGRTDV